MTKGPRGGSQSTRKLIDTINYILDAVRWGCGHSHHALNGVAGRLISTLSTARRMRQLKNEVAELTAHIELINVCHADRIAALEHEHRQKIGTQVDELRVLIAQVLPPNLDSHAQIVISGETARQLWGKFASLSNDDEPGTQAYAGNRGLEPWKLPVNPNGRGLNRIS